MDISHYYIERGSGAPLILLHGNSENSGHFSHQIETFSRYYHVYAPDTRGHGKTPRGDKPFTIRQFAEDLRDVMDGQNIEKAHILGFSDGANIAMIFAMRWPERVDRLILDGGNLQPEGVKRRVQKGIELVYKAAGKLAPRYPTAKALEEMMGLMINDPNIRPEELAPIKARTLVMAGTKDLILEEHTRLIADSIPGSELVFIEGGHLISSQNPVPFNAAVLRFLAK